MNEHLEKHLGAILRQLHAVHAGGDAMSTATRGAEREAFVDLLLRSCLPTTYRFGSGEITDAHGTISGQIDVVVENPFFPSFPLLGTSQHRLYVIEAIAMAIEVKSSCDQFPDAIKTLRKFRELKANADWPKEAPPPSRLSEGPVGSGAPTSFPGRAGFAVVMYQGWERPETLKKNSDDNELDVALQLSPAIFYARDFRETGQHRLIEGTKALAAFLYVVNDELRNLVDWQTNIFRRYVDQVPRPAITHDAATVQPESKS